MTRTTTAGGTVVLSPTAEEYSEMLDREVRSATGFSAAEFTRRFEAGELDWSDPETLYIAGILRLNGPAA